MTKQEYRQKEKALAHKIFFDETRIEISPEIAYALNRIVAELVSLYEETPGFPVMGKNKAIPGNGGVSKPDSVGEGNVTGFCHFLEMQEDLEAYKTMELAFPYNLQELLKRYLKTQPTKDSRDSNKLNGSEEK